MPDPNMDDFRARVARVQRSHARGRGFEAAGTLGRLDFRRRRGDGRPVLRAGLFLLAFAFGLKGALHHHLGAQAYAERVARLEGQSALGAVQAVLMQVDPVTLAVSRSLGQIRASL